ncbi:MAG: type I glutamate--ammonia ligase [Candidatus Latescibacteria bacterium]|nr:type I glutamate--ammonia ligase [Candidatus Latescibacterota bacterium]
MSYTPKDVLEMVKKENVVSVDLKFMDFPGLWQHFSVPVKQLDMDSFEDGFGFDGSSIRGWRTINESDMLVIPDPTTAFVDPFMKYKTLSMICDIVDPITRERYTRCPRNVAKKAELYLQSTGIADTAYVGPEMEFFIFDDVRFDQNEHEGYFHIDSIEGRWNTGREESPNLGYKPRYKEGYFPVSPTDSQQDIREEMVQVLSACGLEIEAQHHEVATGGQGEIDLRFDTLVKMGDSANLYKYILKNVAHRNGKTLTFMPKPLAGDNGTGMHTHISLWKGATPLFAGSGYAGMSEMAMYFVGGILRHSRALAAFTNPTTNSYRRLVPGFEAPVNLAYSQRNRSAAIRFPMYSMSPKAKRVEVRYPDCSGNPYLSFSALLMAGLDGIQNRIDPGDPLDKDIYDLSPEELVGVPVMPGSLEEAIRELESDYEFLMKGDVFTEDVIKTWMHYKMENEVNALRLRPHPWEFAMYYDL